MAGAGFPPHVADRLLNHVEGAIRGVAAVYQRGEFLPERKAALEAWAGHVLACAKQEAEEERAPPSLTRAASQHPLAASTSPGRALRLTSNVQPGASRREGG